MDINNISKLPGISVSYFITLLLELLSEDEVNKFYDQIKGLNMGWVLIVYFVILVLELSVGCSFIIWKCVARSEVECKLAIGGTIFSVAIWMLVVLVCPCFMSPCEICNFLDNMVEKCYHYFRKIKTKKHHEVYIHNEVYLPTTVSLLPNGHEDSIFNNDERTEHLHTSVTKQNNELEQVDILSTKSDNNDTVIPLAKKYEQNRKHFPGVCNTRDIHFLSD